MIAWGSENNTAISGYVLARKTVKYLWAFPRSRFVDFPSADDIITPFRVFGAGGPDYI